MIPRRPEIAVRSEVAVAVRTPVAAAVRPAAPPSLRQKELEVLQAPWSDCKKCRLCEARKSVVFGSGSAEARLLIIGEAPGADEDEQGLPFVGRSGQLLTKMLAAIQLSREEVYITNVVKCRPPSNRAPEPDEVASCADLLAGQLAIIRPELVMMLGASATRALLGAEIGAGISRIRGTVMLHNGIRCIPTYHPAYLLRNPSAKRESWEDLKLVRRLLDGEKAAES